MILSIYIIKKISFFFHLILILIFLVNCINAYGQCGGSTWNGPTSCCAGLSCVYQNSYYSQCSPTTSASTTPASASTTSASASTTSASASTTPASASTTPVSTSTTPASAAIGTYWACCKSSCSWPGKANFTNPIQSCLQDGVTKVDPNQVSVCNSGISYMCTNQQPWNVSSSLSYGFAGTVIIVSAFSFQ